ncbi:proprionate catabolism activator, Fis family [Alkalidesulfovibrio alkalitolerans DSM 16529]|jgi:propionate catabolism operon transcriptional regulator|uniref:Proprionate catabolism activator, Fis family n=1 Tax=Alkalidesulfovibrio alkalitolerans DSM 16529 TaxID=1121439 RepID=S7T998_9BACT|nr:sigma-54-dependent Fis family transcriptional regulator [Alkalidesulfovibrio alkalitolerans]EPR33125.1 proprionate catabolism activator, Fis family [Alkalidesulfovibrio alkalitolerans DSM 16529]
MPDARPFRFAFVSNSEEIARTVKAFEDPDRENIEIRLASMEEALPVARQCLAEGVEVVLGGGATGRLLREQLKLPVVTIARRDMDVIRAVMLARERSRKIAVTSFSGQIAGLEIMEDILGVEIRQLPFRTTPELVAAISKAVAEGFRCIVGGGICKTIAQSVGGEGFVVVPGERVIQQALEEARVIAQSQRRSKEEAERLRIILHSVKEGVVGIDSEGRINLINPMAGEMLGLDPENVLDRPMPEAVRSAGLFRVLESGEAEVDQFRRVGGLDMVINAMPVNVSEGTRAVVATFTRVSRIQDLDRKLKERLAKGFVARYTLDDLKGSCAAMARLRAKAAQYAATDAAILVQGETGTGKEILAQGIHMASPRKRRPFVAVNCSALPETLLESELFGYEEGAFTGAKRGGKQGLFELAHGGTLFLDELADISPSLQVRLLRAIEEKEIMRVGGDRIVSTDVRIIASTFKDLAHEARMGRFRADLYFRIATLKIHTVPLRERAADIPDLLAALLARYDIPAGRSPLPLSPRLQNRFTAHSWPGNVRELDSLAQRYAALVGADKSGGHALLMEIMDELCAEAMPSCGEKPLPAGPADGTSFKDQVREYEREIIAEALRQTGDNKAEAARRLGVSVNTLWRKLRELSGTTG